MAGRVSPSTLEQIRGGNDIVEVIGACLPLKRAGTNFVALCPFHREKTPSFNVNPQKQIFHCFGCHKGGDVFTFIQEYEHLEFAEAVRRLAERAGIPLEWEGEAGQQTKHLKDTLWNIHEQVTQRWQIALANDASAQVARDYLAKRRVSSEAIQLFRLGYAPEAWDDTVNWAKAKNFEPAIMEQAGLILRKEGDNRYYDRFRGRLIFPICDEQGRVIGFSGRILSDEAKTAKYVNSPETPIFAKRRVFYGLDKSKRAILEAKFTIICEGQLDLISCFMAGIKNIVAPQGTAFTGDHARLLKRYVNEVVLCFDSDQAGQTATVRVLDELLTSDLAIRVATVPSPHDPDSFIQAHGGPAFQKLINEALGFFDFYLDYLCARNDLRTDKGRMEVVRAMGEAVRKTKHPVMVDTYAQKTALRLHVTSQAVRAEFQRVPLPKSTEASESADASTPVESEPLPSPKEFWLLKYLFLEDSDMDWVVKSLDLSWLQHPHVRQIAAARCQAHTQGGWRGVPALLNALPDLAAQRLLARALADSRSIPNPRQQLADVIMAIRNLRLDQQLTELKFRLSQPGISDLEKCQLLQQQQQVRQQKLSPVGS